MSGRSPTTLAIDTATELCSVAVLHGDQTTELVEKVGNRHSERVLSMIDAALSRAQLVLGDVDLFAFGAGPGSFTGLRIACGVAQGLAYGKRKQVVPVGNLRALAADAFSRVLQGNLLLAAIDARMNEAYCAIYRRDAHVTEVRAPALERPQTLLQLAADEAVDLVAGNALTVFPDIWSNEARWIALPEVTSTAASIGTLARLDASRGLAVDPELAVPHYVRDHVALTIAERSKAAAASTCGGERTVLHGATEKQR